MCKHRNAPTAGMKATMEAGRGAAEMQRQASCNNYNKLQESCQDGNCYPVSRLLAHGAANAIKGQDLAAILGWPMRSVTQQIQRERLLGSPILATTDARCPGYYLASCPEETDRFLRSLHHREREIQKTRAAIAATQQISLADVQRADGGDL